MRCKRLLGSLTLAACCGTVSVYGQAVSSKETRSLASFPVEGASARGIAVEQGRASLSGGGEVAAMDRPVRVSLTRGGEIELCKGTELRLSQDTAARGGAENDGLVFALGRAGAIETHYTAGRYSDLILTPELELLVSAPGRAELKVSSDDEGNTCVENGGENAPYVTASSRSAGGAYRLLPGQRAVFAHGSLAGVVENGKQPCGCGFTGVYDAGSRVAAGLQIAQATPGAAAAGLVGSAWSAAKTSAGSPVIPQGNIASGPGRLLSALLKGAANHSPKVTLLSVTIPGLSARENRRIFLSGAHRSWLRLHGMDAYLETDVLIMIFAVAITMALSVLIQAIVFVLLFMSGRSLMQKLTWAAEDIKEKVIPAAEGLQVGIRELVPILRDLSDQTGRIGSMVAEHNALHVNFRGPSSSRAEMVLPTAQTARSGHEVTEGQRAELPSEAIEAAPVRRVVRTAVSRVKKIPKPSSAEPESFAN